VAATHAALVSADLLHVAAHGRHRQDNPLFSAVRLVDGQLYAYEIDPAAGLAGCVVLSACEAGLTTLRPGDESLGLSHVLLQLGTRSVIAGVARVGDDVSARLMDSVHQAMARGTDAASALAAAQRENVTDGAVPAFVCLGDTW
jgi:CHAT domain-containing protein